MNIKELKDAIRTSFEIQVPLFILGAPGIGKSQAAAQVATSDKRPLLDIRLPQYNPVDLVGLPVAKDGVAEWLHPGFFPREGGDNENAVILFDELTSANRMLQAAAYQIMLDRKCGSYSLPKGVSILAAGNRKQDHAIVEDISAALRNRLWIVEVEVSLDEWKHWAVNHDVSEHVLSFLSYKPDYIHQYDHKVHGEGNFPTPRSWEFTSRLVKTLGVGKASKSNELIAGLLGEGAATEFCGYLRVADQLPNVEEIVDRGNLDVKCPEKNDAKFALCGAFIGAVLQKEDDKSLLKAFQNVTAYLVKEIPPEFAALVLTDITRSEKVVKVFNLFRKTDEWKAIFKKCAKHFNE